MKNPLVFISAKSEDYDYAERVYKYMIDNGINVFFSPYSLPEMGNSDYRKAIDAKLEECDHMLVVASSRENIEAPWVEAEWGFFINAKRSGEKRGNLIVITACGVAQKSLPPSLRYYEVIPFSEEHLIRVLKYVKYRSASKEDTNNENDIRGDSSRELIESVFVSDGSTFPITIVGIGGAGLNIITKLTKQTGKRIKTVAIDTDSLTLERCHSKQKIFIGEKITKGHGTDGDPELGTKAALENRDEIQNIFTDGDMLIVCAGLGGGTGTGASPIVAKLSKEKYILTIGIITTPFSFEAPKKKIIAKNGIGFFSDACDSLVLIPNSKLIGMFDKCDSFIKLVEHSDEFIFRSIKGFTDVIHSSGLINLDFSDLRTVMTNGGISYLGIGESIGKDRAEKAANKVVSTGYLGDRDLKKASSVLFSIVGKNISMDEVSKANKIIDDSLGEGCQVYWGCYEDDTLMDSLYLTLIATKFHQD